MDNERARALRKRKTGAETKLWWHLRGLKARGFKFRQRAPIDQFIVDFVCLSHRLIVEVDGATLGGCEEREHDTRREAYLVAQGFRVLRVWNGDVYDNIEGVMDGIVHAFECGKEECDATPRPFQHHPRPLPVKGKGEVTVPMT